MIDFDRGAGFGRRRPEAVRRRLERCGFDGLDFDADLIQEIANVGILEQHADGTDQRRLLGNDMIAGDRGDVAAGRRQAIDHDDQRLSFLQPHQRVVELLGAGRGAAGAVDMDHHGAHDRGPGKPVELLHPLLIIPD